MAENGDRFNFRLPAKERVWLKELAWRNRMSEAEVLRLLIKDAAKRIGLPDPDKPAAGNTGLGDVSDQADQTGG